MHFQGQWISYFSGPSPMKTMNAAIGWMLEEINFQSLKEDRYFATKYPRWIYFSQRQHDVNVAA